MAFTIDLPGAAYRHLDAAEKLLENNREDVAAYLFGIAAECAVKALARSVPAARTDEIFYAHFPRLRTLLLDALQGRLAQPLRRLIEHGSFMSQWDVRMRYAPSSEVRSKPVEEWAKQARRAIAELGTL